MKYQEFQMKSVKATSRKGTEITIIDPTKIDEFLSALQNDESISLEIKALVAMGLSTGGRIEELLAIKKSDISDDYVNLLVLKKRLDARREAKIHPVAKALVEQIVRRGDQYLFRLDRKQAWYQLKKHFGMCNHSLRHTHISYLVEQGVHQMKIMKIMNLSNTNVVAAYSHCNVRRELDDVWGNKKAS